MDALKLIKHENPFPAVCGAICNRRCEDACTRGTIDQAVAIDEIKKFIAEQEINSANRFVPKVENHEGKEFTEKMAIIGAGPSGMSAAYYLREKGYPVTIFEKEQRAGGMLMNGIPSFRLEKSVIEAEIDVLRQMGVEFKFGVEVGKDVTIQQLREQGYKAFYVAIGAQGGRKTGVPGEDAEGVVTGVEFLRKANISEDAHALSGDTVVIGGGNVAIDVSRNGTSFRFHKSIPVLLRVPRYHAGSSRRGRRGRRRRNHDRMRLGSKRDLNRERKSKSSCIQEMSLRI